MRTEALAEHLTTRYGLAVLEMTQLPIGQNTVNYRAVCEDRAVFVKNYPPGTDLPAERDAIGLSELARHHRIPAAAVIANRDGEVIDTSSAAALSVWQWMPGQVITTLNPAQYTQAGDALGRIHTLFATLPVRIPVSTALDTWRTADTHELTTVIDQLLGIIAARRRAGIADAFDDAAEQTLTERAGMLARIPQLLAELPPELTVQVVHGDYSPVNMLFAGDQLAAVLDFCPPDPFLLAFDLGRMAFYPDTVTGDPNWAQAARTLISAYLAAGPTASGADIRACGRVALLQLLGSLYGVKQHYLKPGLFQDALDEFWLRRHHTATVLLDHLAETDDLLVGLAVAHAHG